MECLPGWCGLNKSLFGSSFMRNIILVFSSVLVLSTTHALQVTVRPMSGNPLGVFDLPNEGNLYLELFKRINALPDTKWPMPKIGKVTDKITFVLGIEPLSEHVSIENIADLDGAEITIIPNYSEQRLILPFMPNSNWTIVLYGALSQIRTAVGNDKKHTLSEHLESRITGMRKRKNAPQTQDVLNFATLFLQSSNISNHHGTGMLDKYISYFLEQIVLIHKGRTYFTQYTFMHKESLDGISPIQDGIVIIDDDGNEKKILGFQGSALQALQNLYASLKDNQDDQINQNWLDNNKPQAWKLVDTTESLSHALFLEP